MPLSRMMGVSPRATHTMSARLERHRRRRRRGGAGRVTLVTVAVIIAAIVIVGLSAVGYVVGIANSAPDLDTLKPLDPGRNSIVYAADGKQLGIIQNDVQRRPIASSEIPKNIRQATVAIEDHRFYAVSYTHLTLPTICSV